jgi:hypothetical protein
MVKKITFKPQVHADKSFLDYEVLESQKVDHVELNTLRANQITGIIPMSIMQSDEAMTCSYDITSMMNLKMVLEKNITKRPLYQLLNELMKNLKNAQDYMLNIEHVVLDMEYVFLKPESMNTYLIVIPQQDIEKDNEISLREFIQSIIAKVKYQPEQVQDDFYLKLYDYVNSINQFTPDDFLEKINQLMGIVKPEMLGSTEDRGESAPVIVMPAVPKAPIKQKVLIAPDENDRDGFYKRQREITSKQMKEQQKEDFQNMENKSALAAAPQIPAPDDGKGKKKWFGSGKKDKEVEVLQRVSDEQISITDSDTSNGFKIPGMDRMVYF